MGTSIYYERKYTVIICVWSHGKQSQTKPIMWKGKRKKESKSGVSPVSDLKKQSQFAKYHVGVNVLS
jgi:hypothetical protein